MPNYCFVNGKITPIEEAHVPIRDLGILRGYGVFDVLRTYNGQPFREADHLKRLERSANTIGLKLPFSKTKIARTARELLAKNKFKESIIRIGLTGGASSDGMYPDGPPTFFILLEPFVALPRQTYTKGVKVITRPHRRELAYAKTLSYITAIKLRGDKEQAGAFEIIYTYHGRILEATTCNFFAIIDGKLVTPKRTILIGITRKVVLELAKDIIEIEERDIMVEEISQMTEAFLTATNKDIVPLVQINDQTVGNGRVGPITKKLMKIFEEYTRDY